MVAILLDAADLLDGRKHVCGVCARAFRYRTNLAQHMVTHTDARPYECGVCAKTFRRKCVRDVHLLSHSSARPHACPCGKSFRTKTNLVQHMATHSDARPYECGVCAWMFRRKEARDRHLRTHTS